MNKLTRSPLSFGRRELIATLVGVLLYAGISWITNIFPLTAAEGVDIRPGVAVPIFVGLVFGPIAGFVTGTAGNLLSDLWTGWLAYPPDPATGNLLLDLTQGYLLNWQVGSGLMGLVAGLAPLLGRHYRTLADHLRALGFSLLGIVVGMGFASLTDVWLDDLTVEFVLTQYFLPGVQVNAINTVILIPILLFNYEHLDLASLAWWRSGLMRRLLLGILVSAALPVALLGLFLTQRSADATVSQAELIVKLSFTVLLTLVFTIANAALLAQGMLRPLLRLTDAARRMEADDLTQDQAADLETTAGSDEIGHLSQVFGRMAQEVIQREAQLRQQVQQLRIEIDEVKKSQQVAAITESEYFQTLKERAQQLRRGKDEDDPAT